MVGFDYALFPNVSHRNTQQIFFENGDVTGDVTRVFVVDEFAPDYEIAKVKKYIQENRDEPFFLFYNLSPPHMPLADAPVKYTKMYKRDDVHLRKNVWRKGKMAYDEHWFKIYLWDYRYFANHESGTEKLPEDFDLRDLTALYYGLVTCVDDKVGELINCLEDNGISEDTIILFLSDHGDHLGSHHLFNKGQLIEESIRIPMIFQYQKDIQKGVASNHIAQIIDIMPTIIELCGGKIPSSAQGRSLVPILREDIKELQDNFAFIETYAYQIGIRTPTHIYGMKLGQDKRSIADEKFCFFDLRSDPYEECNLAKTDQQKGLADALCRKLKVWHKSTSWLKT